MKKKQKVYGCSFKEKAVLLSYERGCIEQVEKELEITPTLLNRWRQDYQKFGTGSFCGTGYLKLSLEQDKIYKLEKRIQQAELQSEILKKGIPYLLQGKQGVFQFIKNHEDIYTIKLMCCILNTTPRSYHKWKTHFVSETQKRRNAPKQEITAIFFANKQRYGCARITIKLQKSGYKITSATVGRYMRELGHHVSVKKE